MKMKLLSLTLSSLALAAPLAAQASADLEEADRPGRGVARISLINGDVTVKRGDSGDLTAAAINAPLVVQDRVFAGPNSRAELQFDYSNMIRMAAHSEVRIAEIEQNRYMVQLARGLVTFRVLREHTAEVELSTPSISIRPVKRGEYRIEVREDGTTEVTVRSGEAEMFTPQGTERIKSGHTVVARGTSTNPELRDSNEIPQDDWDRWNDRCDRDLQRSNSYRYMSTDISGGKDLDDHGRWVDVPQYGHVWSPRVAAGWAPYRQGRWSWIDWYGWSWVTYDPWGWAPYHYGRWFNQPGYGWCWWPGGVQSRHWWRPALVGFFGWGGGGFNTGIGFGFGHIGWTPLAPYERFRPWNGGHSYGGFRNNNNFGNSVRIVNNVNITNIYRNARHNGVSGMDHADFVGGRGNRIRGIGESDLRGASSVEGRLPIVPARQSFRLADREVSQRGSGASDNTRFFSRRQPAQVERASFDEQRRGVEQVARRTFGGEGTRAGSGESGRSTEAGGRGERQSSGRSADAGGVRVTGEPGSNAPRESRNADGGGWRSVGDAGGRSSAGDGVERGSGDAGRNADRGDWRAVGDASRRSPDDVAGRSTGAEARRNADNGGWRTFGDSGRRSDGAGRSADSGRVGSSADSGRGSSGETSHGRGADNGGWRRFGSADSGRDGSAGDPRASAPSDSGRSNDGGSRRRDGTNRSSDSSQGWGGNRGGGGGGGEVQVSPPIVRDRSGESRSSRSSDRGSSYESPRSSGRENRGDSSDRNAAPAWDGGGRGGRGGDSGGGGGRSAAPAWDGGGRGSRGGDSGGGGGRSAAPSFGGGGGGGRGGDSGGGGGRSSDGGGGRRSSGGGGGRSR